MNYLKIALRHLKKHSFYTVLNIVGLSLGIACTLILFQFIQYHLGYNSNHHSPGQIYRVVTDLRLDDGSVHYDRGAPIVLGTTLKAAMPQIKEAAVLFKGYRNRTWVVSVPAAGGGTGGEAARGGTGGVGGGGDVRGGEAGERGGERRFNEHENVAFGDHHWFGMFDYQWLAGDPATALEQPGTAVLTRKQAEKYFGKQDPMGKIIRIDNKQDVRITGLLADYAANTDARVDVFVSMPTLKALLPDLFPSLHTEWGFISSATSLYVQLPEGQDPATVDKAIGGLTRTGMGDLAKYYHFHLQPLADVHFDLRYGGSITRSLLTTLGIIGFFILIIACVNFINLATAQSTTRAREIGTRKVLGSSKAAIFRLFITETACITVIAGLFALEWASLGLSLLNHWLHTDLRVDLWRDRQMLGALISLMLFVTLAAGFYPALLLSNFKPVEVLKGGKGRSRRPWLRNGLIVLQNLVAQSLIICTLIIALQVNYVKTADMGFNTSAVVMVAVPPSRTLGLAFVREQLMRIPAVRDVSFCFRPPASSNMFRGSVRFDRRDWEPYAVPAISGDAHYLSTFGLQLVAGRNLSESDTIREFLINENMMRKLGLTKPEQVIGKQLVAGSFNDHAGTIVGVVKDFHFESFHNAIEPLMITTVKEVYAYAAVKIGTGRGTGDAAGGGGDGRGSAGDGRSGAGPGETGTVNAGAVIGQIKQLWGKVFSENVFEYRFLDEQIADFYEKEDLMGNLVMGAAALAIVISCIGLLGLISLLTIQRTKEIGIRKVIGASVMGVTVLLSTEFVKLVSFALVLASLLGWVVMQQWLQGFAYRITIPWWVFLLAGLCNLALALLTIGYHAVKAALANPVHALKGD